MFNKQMLNRLCSNLTRSLFLYIALGFFVFILVIYLIFALLILIFIKTCKSGLLE